MKPTEPVSATPLEMLGIIILCFGWAIAGSFAALAPGTPDAELSDAAIMNLVLFELMIGAIAMLVLRQRGYVIRELLPKPTLKGCAIGFVLYVAFTLLHSFVVLPWVPHLGGQAAEQAAAGAAPSMVVVLLLGFVNGLYEEVFSLGYIVRGLGKYGASLAIGVSSLIRLLCRVDQGPIEALSIVVFSLVLGIYYWRTRDLWSVVFAHMLADVLPFVFPD